MSDTKIHVPQKYEIKVEVNKLLIKTNRKFEGYKMVNRLRVIKCSVKLIRHR